MSDEVFNTLLAVVLMCHSHYADKFTGNMTAFQEKWETGFEQCATIQKEVDVENVRRDMLKEAKRIQQDKERLANALAALKGKKFTPEAAPPVQKPLFSNSCIEPANGIAR